MLLTRGLVTLLGIAGLVLPASRLPLVVPLVLGAFVLLRGTRAVGTLMVSVATLAVPLFGIHGIINPTFPATDCIGPLPWRTAGGWYAFEMAQRFGLLFMAVSVWRGVPALTLVALMAKCRMPPAAGLVLVYAVVLVEIFKRRIQNIQLAMRSRGLLDGDSFRSRLHALVAMTVPLMAISLTEAVMRSEVRSRLGGMDIHRLLQIAPPPRPSARDIAASVALLGAFLWVVSHGG